MRSVADTAVPANTEGVAAVRPSVPSVCTKYCCPGVRPVCNVFTAPPACIMAVDPLAVEPRTVLSKAALYTIPVP